MAVRKGVPFCLGITPELIAATPGAAEIAKIGNIQALCVTEHNTEFKRVFIEYIPKCPQPTKEAP
jgi:hypothetical protein